MDSSKRNPNRSNLSNMTNLNLTNEEKKILELLSEEDLTSDDMIRKSHLHAAAVGSLLSLLEIKGYIKGCGGKYRLNVKFL